MQFPRPLSILAAFTLVSLAWAGCDTETDVETDTTPPPVEDTTTGMLEDEDAGNEYTPASAREEEQEDEAILEGGMVGQGDAMATQVDGEILGKLIAIDENEIAAATEAQRKQLSQAVMDYALMLEEAHSRHKDQTQSLANQINLQPAENASVQEVRSKGAQMMSNLAPLEGEEFERAFIDAMVQGHTDALNTIDQSLEKVMNEQLREHLNQTRTTFEEHLRKAQELQGQIGG